MRRSYWEGLSLTVVHQKSEQLLLLDCEISLADKIACLKREIAYREKVYGRLVANGTMDPEKAYREVAIMEAILKDYEPCR